MCTHSEEPILISSSLNERKKSEMSGFIIGTLKYMKIYLKIHLKKWSIDIIGTLNYYKPY